MWCPSLASAWGVFVSEKLVFGDKDSAERMRRSKRAYLSDTLDVVARKAQGRAALDYDAATWAKMLPAPSVPSVVSRKRRARRARINTIAPSNYMGAFRVIYQGLDALVLNVKGAVRADFMALLPMAQDEAKEAEEPVLSPLPPFLGENLSIRPYGGGTYRFLVGNADVVAKIRRADHAANMACAQVELTSACLHRLGWQAAVKELVTWLKVWCPLSVYQPSEVDLAADTQGWQPDYPDFQRRAFVCPVSRPHLIPYEAGHIGYVRFGTGGRSGSRSGQAPIQAVIYDKTEEIRSHDKGWFVPLWAQSPDYDEDDVVTRIEFRYRREYLKERGIGTVSELVRELNALWCEGLEWCRYCVPEPDDGDENRSRWAVRDEWRLLRGLDWSGGGRLPLARIDQARPRLERTLASLGGYLVTTQALFAGVMEWDIDEIASLAVGAIKKRWESRGESYDLKVSARALRLGGLAMA